MLRVTSWLTHLDDDDKENAFDLPSELAKKKRRLSAGMEDNREDVELTPRPTKKRRLDQDDIEPPEQFSPMPAQSEDAASELESHHSGRVSPTKQLAYLEDSSEPVIYCDFATTTAEIPEEVSTLCEAVQLLGDGVGILGFEVSWQREPLGRNSD